MKRIVFVGAGVSAAAAAGVGYGFYPGEVERLLIAASRAFVRVWEAVEANPFPVLVALGTFVLTVVYHKARGKSLRESVEVAATRVTVIPVPQPSGGETETGVVKRARARATRTQLLADQIGLQNRQRKLPEEIVKAEKEACYTQQALADAERALEAKRAAHAAAAAKVESLHKENDERAAEIADIETELKKLADLV